MVILKNQSAQNLERFQEWWEETKFQECAKIYHIGHTGIAHRSNRLYMFQNKSGPSDLFDPFIRFQRHFSDMSGLRSDMSDELYDHWNLNITRLVWPFSKHVWVPNPTLTSERVFISEWPEPILSHATSLIGMVDRSDRFALTAPTTSFSRFL
jgi:hypothetical protein